MKKIFCILTTLLFATCMMAQAPKDQRSEKRTRKEFSPEEFEKRMQEFITNEAKLTEEESAKFFPLLKEMLNAQMELDSKSRKMHRLEKELTEADCKKIIQETTNMEVQHKEIERTYYTKKFPKVLSYKKILKVRWATERFKMEALKHFSPRSNNQNPHRKNARTGKDNK